MAVLRFLVKAINERFATLMVQVSMKSLQLAYTLRTSSYLLVVTLKICHYFLKAELTDTHENLYA